MTDYIKRDDAIKTLEGWKISGEMILAIVPSADVVEVVRCKDCVYREVKGEGMTHWFGCRIMEHNDDDWYCGFGERADT